MKINSRFKLWTNQFLLNKKPKGFTLIELLIVIAIIGLLSTTAVISLNMARLKARDTRRKADLRQISKALDLYYDAYSYFPPTRPSSSCGGYRNDFATSYCSLANWLTTDNNFLKFIPLLPKDPLNKLVGDDTPWWQSNTYTYGVSSDGQSYDLLTSLENTSDKDRCELKLWYSVAVWPGDTGCWSSGVFDRSKQIFAIQ